MGRALCLLALWALPAAAQTGVLVGTVTDAATQRPLADVRVTVHVPARHQVRHVVTTDAGGHYRVAQLPPATYALAFEAPGYAPLVRTDVLLRMDRTVRIDAALSDAARSDAARSDAARAASPPAHTPEAPPIDPAAALHCGSIDPDFARQLLEERTSPEVTAAFAEAPVVPARILVQVPGSAARVRRAQEAQPLVACARRRCLEAARRCHGASGCAAPRPHPLEEAALRWWVAASPPHALRWRVYP